MQRRKPTTMLMIPVAERFVGLGNGVENSAQILRRCQGYQRGGYKSGKADQQQHSYFALQD
jgi:hypothetical protein